MHTTESGIGNRESGNGNRDSEGSEGWERLTADPA